LQEAIEWVGCEKVMWGTDQPGLLGHANLPQLVRLAETQLDFLAPAERARVMGLNALEVFWGD
jgi:predicted TIM-barrel fold metal-dependent hydrolase